MVDTTRRGFFKRAAGIGAAGAALAIVPKVEAKPVEKIASVYATVIREEWTCCSVAPSTNYHRYSGFDAPHRDED